MTGKLREITPHNRLPAEIEKEIVALVRDKIGPVATSKLAITVARLPKTRSDKILRGTMKKIADHEPWTMPATIDDPAILDEIRKAMKEKGVSFQSADRVYVFLTYGKLRHIFAIRSAMSSFRRERSNKEIKHIEISPPGASSSIVL